LAKGQAQIRKLVGCEHAQHCRHRHCVRDKRGFRLDAYDHDEQKTPTGIQSKMARRLLVMALSDVAAASGLREATLSTFENVKMISPNQAHSKRPAFPWMALAV
jgi:hypothetical protein